MNDIVDKLRLIPASTSIPLPEKPRWNLMVGAISREAADTIDRLRAEVATLKEQNAMLTVQVQEAQAEIDRLMLELCPAEMPEEQVANWGKHQQAVQVCPECDIAGCRHIRSALPQQVKSEDDDTALLNAIQENSWDLVSRTLTSGDDCEIGWQVIEHHMAKPYERVIGENFQDDARAAIRAAISAQENKS